VGIRKQISLWPIFGKGAVAVPTVVCIYGAHLESWPHEDSKQRSLGSALVDWRVLIMYDKNNVFYKILQSEIPSKKIYEDESVLSFYDINPACKVHALVIPKTTYVDFHDFVTSASANDVKHFFDVVVKVADMLQISKTGYRILSNVGDDSGQEIPHFHVHILGGEKLRRQLQ
jgi:diadenosine tetraphosphate (Ap4A) HIT family hydrolase